MIMYSITLGSYFTYIAKHDMLEGFTDYYSVFRKNSNVKNNFNIFFISQTFIAILSLMLNLNKNIYIQILPIFGSILVGILHSLSGFLKSEEYVNSSEKHNDKNINNYIKYNIPLHILYSIYYSISSFLLLYIK